MFGFLSNQVEKNCMLPNLKRRRYIFEQEQPVCYGEDWAYSLEIL